MKLLILMLLSLPLFAQENTGFNEIDPAREEKLKKMEWARKELQRRKELKIKEEEKARIIAEDEKRKKEEVAKYTQWLISERDRRLKEAAEAEAEKKRKEASEKSAVKAVIPATVQPATLNSGSGEGGGSTSEAWKKIRNELPKEFVVYLLGTTRAENGRVVLKISPGEKESIVLFIKARDAIQWQLDDPSGKVIAILIEANEKQTVYAYSDVKVVQNILPDDQWGLSTKIPPEDSALFENNIVMKRVARNYCQQLFGKKEKYFIFEVSMSDTANW